MRPRSPWLLWRFLLSDVCRTLLLALGGLVGVIAFAAAMRPLAEGRVGPIEALWLAGLLAVPMLQFALPFAAGLAATLAYHRFAAENEASAAMAGGMSHRAILAPALALGVVLALLLALLSHQVIPRFLRSAEQILTRDAARMIVAPVERGETIQLGRWDIRADEVVRARSSSGDGGADHLVLKRVLAHRVDKPESFVDADRVDLWILGDDGGGGEDAGARAVLRFNEARVCDRFNIVQAQGPFTEPLRIPSTFRDDPKFLSYPELVEVQKRPELINRIEWRRRALADRLAMRDMIQDTDRALRGSGVATLVRRGDVFTLHAGGLAPDRRAWSLVPAKGSPAEVRVDMTLEKGRRQTHRAASALLSFRDIGNDPSPDGSDASRAWLRLDLRHVSTNSPDGAGAESQSDEQWYSALTTRTDHAARRAAQTSAELLQDAALITGTSGEPGADIKAAARELDLKVRDLQREAVSKLHERAALSLSCLLMVLTGAVTALKLREALPLHVYLWSFLPALACVITISAGQGLAHKLGAPGLLLLWGGAGLLALYTVAAYTRLRRN